MMLHNLSHLACRTDRRGAILVLVAVLLPVIVILAAFAVDVAWMQLVRTELRTATDAAARAGASILSASQDEASARAAAIDAASQNEVAGVGLKISGQDVLFGHTQQNGSGRFVFDPASSEPINAVRVNGRRTTDSVAGPVDLFFAKVLGRDIFEPQQTATATLLDRDICLVIDRSGSMTLTVDGLNNESERRCGPLPDDSRFAALDTAVLAFLEELEITFSREQVALASYSSQFSESCPSGAPIELEIADIRQSLTQDYTELRNQMNQFMQVGIGGRTAIGEGLRKGIEAVTAPAARPFAVKTIVLMTDGLHNTGVEPIVLARQAARQNIVVHTVSFSAQADQQRMRAVADATNGVHLHADTATDLADRFRQLARTLPTLLTE